MERQSEVVLEKNCLDHLVLCLDHLVIKMRFESSIARVLALLVIFQPMNLLYTLLPSYNTPEKNLPECELMLYLVWNNSSVFIENTKQTKSDLAINTFKSITKASICNFNTDQ